MPSFLRKENARHVPVNALWLSNGLIQLFLIITLFNASTYLSLLYLATSMILVPYFWSAAYALLLGVRGEGYANAAGERRKDTLIAAVATLYAVWLVYAGGMQYLLLSALLYAPGDSRPQDHRQPGRHRPAGRGAQLARRTATPAACRVPDRRCVGQ